MPKTRDDESEERGAPGYGESERKEERTAERSPSKEAGERDDSRSPERGVRDA